jgi:predicted metal-dependent HD superfamily phosphohydrolase
MIAIEKRFKNLLNKYTSDKKQIDQYWLELEKSYNFKSRYYHNLNHINELLQFYDKYENELIKKNVVLFAIFYHDIIYDIKKKDNEKQSAEFAKNSLKNLNIEQEIINFCYDYIFATKKHNINSSDTDLAYFLDFDMAVLGKDWEDYHIYTEKICKEYRIYPSILYKKGRKKALESFLQTEQIYKTDTFFKLFEEQARKNIQKEINLL